MDKPVSGHRQQELLVVVAATLAAAEGQRHRVRRSVRAAVPTRQQGRDPVTHAGGSRALRKGPILRDGGTTVWDSLAICEYAAERWPSIRGWPADLAQRAHARAISAEMHSGFATLRSEMPMNCRRKHAPVTQGPQLQAEIDRVSGNLDEFSRGGFVRTVPVRHVRNRRCHVRTGGAAAHHLSGNAAGRSAFVCRCDARAAVAATMVGRRAQRNRSARAVRALSRDSAVAFSLQMRRAARVRARVVSEQCDQPLGCAGDRTDAMQRMAPREDQQRTRRHRQARHLVGVAGRARAKRRDSSRRWRCAISAPLRNRRLPRRRAAQATRRSRSGRNATAVRRRRPSPRDSARPSDPRIDTAVRARAPR